ncbi:MAG: hemolysin family protein [Bacteroidota bacterium]
MLSDYLILLSLLFFSAFFSSTEIAYLVSNKIKITLRSRKKNIFASNAYYFIKNPDLFFSALLISNNIVNIAFASLFTVFLISSFGIDEAEILIITTIILLFFGKFLPKFVGRELADPIILLSSLPLRLVLFILYPLVKITSKVSSVLDRMNKKEEEEILQIFDKEDIQNLIEESSEDGKMNEDQSEIITKVIEIREQRVYEAITPRTDIVGVEITSTIEEVTEKFIESGYSKLIVYDENLDNIKGMVLLKDLFNQPKSLSEMVREVVFVPDTKKSLEMLNEFLEQQFTLAVVVDEFGGTAGIITIEDLIEELFGEISDEYDEEEKVVRQIDNYTYILSGKVEIDNLNEEFGFTIDEEGDFETVAGYVTAKLGRIPVKGETFKIDNYSVLILKSDKTKIDLLKLRVEPDQPE